MHLRKEPKYTALNYIKKYFNKYKKSDKFLVKFAILHKIIV